MKKVCIVGYGAIGPIHAKAVSESPYAELYAVCDCDKERLKRCAETYDVKTYLSFDDVLNDKSVDSVHICTPHFLHSEMVIKALAAGKDIVLEKPAAMNREELENIRRAYEKSNNKICIVLQNRTNAGIEMLKKIAESDKSVGQLMGITAFMTWKRDEAYYKHDSWRGKWQTEGGGAMINQAVHLLDMVDYIGGIEAIRAGISTKLLYDAIEVEDTADALIFLKNNAHACFYAANTYVQDSPFRLEADFENASFRYADNRLYKITDSVEIIAEDVSSVLGKKYWGAGHKKVIDDFYANLCGENRQYIDFTDGYNSMKALFAFYESALSGKTVKL